jgi:group I intron endonuclease
MDNNKIKIMSIITYVDSDKNKALILKDNNRKSGIYLWTILIPNKPYIGSSINLKGRFSIYYYKKAMLSKLNTRKSIIFSAILKHGYVNFSLDILEYCEKKKCINRKRAILFI